MALPNPNLLTSTGATFQISPILSTQTLPNQLTFTTGAAVSVGGNTIPVAITAPGGVTLASTTIYDGTYLLVGSGATAQIVIVRGDQLATVTTLNVEPVSKAISSGSVFKSYVDAVPVIGLEAANLQLQKEVNQVVLLASNGWQSRSYSTGSFQFSGNLYIPQQNTLAVGARRVIDSLINEKLVYVERFLSNGDYMQGTCLVTDASDTTQGAQFVTINATFQGSGKPAYATIA